MKKFESLIWKLFGLFAIIGITSVMVSCTGSDGPAGPSGKDGRDANIVCGVCHGASATNVAEKFNQYDLSKHNTGIIYEEEAGRLQCGGCHTGDGFAEAAAAGVNDPVSHATSKINCIACHKIHTNFDSTDFALRITSGFALRQTGATIDMKTGNLCSKCHQARAYTRTVPDTIKSASKGSSYSRFGPHYGVITNVVTMNGPVQIPGSMSYPTSNPHASLPKGCVSCHLNSDPTNPAVGGHTFSMPIANVGNIKECDNACHSAAELKAYSLTKQNAADLAVYRQKLIDKGWLDTTQAVSAEGYNVLGEYAATPGGQTQVYTNSKDVDVILNYLYLAKEKSHGAHNPKYIQALIKNGLEYLNQ